MGAFQTCEAVAKGTGNAQKVSFLDCEQDLKLFQLVVLFQLKESIEAANGMQMKRSTGAADIELGIYIYKYIYIYINTTIR